MHSLGAFKQFGWDNVTNIAPMAQGAAWIEPCCKVNKVTKTNWQPLNLQHACCSHKNVILNENNKSRSRHPRFDRFNMPLQRRLV